MKELIKKLNLEDFFRIIKNDKFEYAGGFKGFPELKIGLLDSYLKFKKKDQSERDFRHDYFKNSDVDKLFEETSKIREDFLKQWSKDHSQWSKMTTKNYGATIMSPLQVMATIVNKQQTPDQQAPAGP